MNVISNRAADEKRISQKSPNIPLHLQAICECVCVCVLLCIDRREALFPAVRLSVRPFLQFVALAVRPPVDSVVAGAIYHSCRNAHYTLLPQGHLVGSSVAFSQWQEHHTSTPLPQASSSKLKPAHLHVRELLQHLSGRSSSHAMCLCVYYQQHRATQTGVPSMGCYSAGLFHPLALSQVSTFTFARAH